MSAADHIDIHRVAPTIGSITRLPMVFAFDDEPDVALSDPALSTFHGRSA